MRVLLGLSQRLRDRTHSYYAPDLTHKRLARHIRDQPRTLKKRATNGFGLKDDSVTLYKNGVALGWLPNFETRGSVAAVNAPVPFDSLLFVRMLDDLVPSSMSP